MTSRGLAARRPPGCGPPHQSFTIRAPRGRKRGRTKRPDGRTHWREPADWGLASPLASRKRKRVPHTDTPHISPSSSGIDAEPNIEQGRCLLSRDGLRLFQRDRLINLATPMIAPADPDSLVLVRDPIPLAVSESEICASGCLYFARSPRTSGAAWCGMCVVGGRVRRATSICSSAPARRRPPIRRVRGEGQIPHCASDVDAL
jgi:hypothetical protein